MGKPNANYCMESHNPDNEAFSRLQHVLIPRANQQTKISEPNTLVHNEEMDLGPFDPSNRIEVIFGIKVTKKIIPNYTTK